MQSRATSDVHDVKDAVTGATHDVTPWIRIASDLPTDDVTDDVTTTEQQLDSDQALTGIDLPAFFKVSPIVHILAVSIFTIFSLTGN